VIFLIQFFFLLVFYCINLSPGGGGAGYCCVFILAGRDVETLLPPPLAGLYTHACIHTYFIHIQPAQPSPVPRQALLLGFEVSLSLSRAFTSSCITGIAWQVDGSAPGIFQSVWSCGLDPLKASRLEAVCMCVCMCLLWGLVRCLSYVSCTVCWQSCQWCVWHILTGCCGLGSSDCHVSWEVGRVASHTQTHTHKLGVSCWIVADIHLDHPVLV